MDERSCKIARAGHQVISQYGIRRATMNDIACAAGVSRQTIYNVFPNREELLAAVARYHFFAMWQSIRSAVEGVEDRHKRIGILLDTLMIASWEKVQAMPHADELELEMDTIMREKLVEVHADALRNLCEFFLPYESQLESRGITARGLSQMVHISIAGLKLTSTSREQIETLVSTMKACLIAVTD